MSRLPEITDFQDLFLNDVPLMDTRAPVEFDQGAFPCAENLPLLTDEERHQVGIRYKEAGQDAAIELGYRLVSRSEKERRIEGWLGFARRHPGGALYCFRGGLRSKLTQEMLAAEAGVVYPRIRGGYKAMRRFLIEATEAAAREVPLVVIGGRTGVGKTHLINDLAGGIDLEGVANHLGSAFGRRATPQPPQIGMENDLAVRLLKHRAGQGGTVVVEDEGRNIGSREIPLPFFRAMAAAPLVLLERPLEERVEIGLQDYVTDPFAEFEARFGTAEAPERFSAHLLAAVDRIRRRLGGARHQEVKAQLRQALAEFFGRGELDTFRSIIRRLLVEYYDPMYDYQIAKRAERIRFQGSEAEVRDWLAGPGRAAAWFDPRAMAERL